MGFCRPSAVQSAPARRRRTSTAPTTIALWWTPRLSPRVRPPTRILVHLDRILPADSVALGTHHPGTQLVKHLECRLVATNTELALELKG